MYCNCTGIFLKIITLKISTTQIPKINNQLDFEYIE